MGDIIDRACEREQYDRDLAIANAVQPVATLPACGQCYNCLTELPEGSRFCDSECRNDFTARKAAEVRHGL